MSSTPFIDCSSGVATDCSMVSASAPGYCAVTMICGGTIDGNWAIGRPSSATSPPSTVTIAMTIATIGRRMKKRDMSVGLGRGRRRLRRHHRAVAQVGRVDDHAVAGAQAFVDHPAGIDPCAERHGAHRYLVVLRDDADLIAVLELGDGALRHQQDVLAN